MVKKCTGQSIILAQDKVIRGNGWHGIEDGKKIKIKFLKLEFSEGQVSCPNLRVPKKVDLQRTPLAKVLPCWPLHLFPIYG